MLPAAGLDLPWFSPRVLTSGGVKGRFPDTDSDVCLVHPNQLGFLALRNCTGGIKSSRYNWVSAQSLLILLVELLCTETDGRVIKGVVVSLFSPEHGFKEYVYR